MLKPQFINGIPDRVVEIMGDVEIEMLEKIAEHIALYGRVTGTAEFLTLKQRQYSLLYSDLVEIISRRSGLLEKEVEEAFRKAAITSTGYENATLSAMGITVDRFTGIATKEAMTAILGAAIARAKQLQNLTNTSCLQGGMNLYTRIVDKAYLGIVSGAKTQEAAYRQALNELAHAGITIAEYTRNGRVYNYSIEANVRRNLVTSVNGVIGQLTEQTIKQSGCNIVETTSHAGARPSHAEWQGKRFWYDHPEKGYESFREVCGYGEADGICGINCYHSWYIADTRFPTAYERDPSARLGISNNEQYELQQKQRRYERGIREAKKQAAVYRAAGDKDNQAKANRIVRERQAALREFIKEHPNVLSRDYSREAIQGQ